MARERSRLAEVTALYVLTLELNDFARKWRKEQKRWREAAASPSAPPCAAITNPENHPALANSSRKATLESA
jgi:hypothetical protein